MESNKKVISIVTELFLGGRKQYMTCFISQSYFKVPKTIRLNATHYFIIKISSKREPRQITSNHLPDIVFKDFMKLHKDYTKEPHTFLGNDATLSSENLLRFRKNLR